MPPLSQPLITPSLLLDGMGITPVDYGDFFSNAVPWKSRLAGEQVHLLFQWREFLETVSRNPLRYGPLSFAALYQKGFLDQYLIEPILENIRKAVREGRNPDLFGEINAGIYREYARLLMELTGCFITDGRFDDRKARKAASGEGQAFLHEFLTRFARLEYGYCSLGPTRLKAMKDLLKCLLVTVTQKPLDGEPLPFAKPGTESGEAFAAYLEENRIRFANLHRENAIDILEYAERATGGKIGLTPYDVVPGSSVHTVRLRHYRNPGGVKKNGKILYIASPLINKPEIFDLAAGKSVVEGMLQRGYQVYLVDYGDAGPGEANLGLDFYGQAVHDKYLALIHQRHPGREVLVMAYCMAGALMMPYLARRAEEHLARGETMDIRSVALMATPVKFDDGDSGHGPMRAFIRKYYDTYLMKGLFGDVNVPPQVIQQGMNEIQPGVQYTVSLGFYGRAHYPGALEDSASFLYWLTHGTRFPSLAHRQWLQHFFLGNALVEGTYALPSSVPALDGKPVRMDALREAGVRIFDYRGTRDPIAPPGSCVASELWGGKDDGNVSVTRGGLNRTIEKNVGHIFVVSKQLLAEYLELVSAFLEGGARASGAE